ncbi:MAG: hypothetical protein LM580_03380 [Thermofilum sp.]|nr:hypothetical protein [Thermofilum sp.]
MAQQTEKKYEPRYVHAPADLVFFTDTDDEGYPIYVLNDRSLQYKRLPKGTTPLATFHVKKVSVFARLGESGWSDTLSSSFFSPADPAAEPSEIEEKYGIPLTLLLTAAKEFAAYEKEVFAKIIEITYEVYRGEYGDFIAEAPARFLHIAIVPKYSKLAPEKQRWAITYSTLKRMRQKHPIFAQYEKFTYVKKKEVGAQDRPYIVIKIPLPSPEFEKAFYEALGTPVAPVAAAPAPPPAAEEEVDVVRLFEEPEELPAVSPAPAQPAAQPTVQPTAPAPAAPTPTPIPTAVGEEEAEEEEEERERATREELVELYLLSMRLPSKYLVQRVENENEGEVRREVRKWEGETAKLATALQTLRWNAYSAMSRVFAYVEEYGVWVAVTEEAVKEAERVSEYVRKKLAELGLAPLADRYIVRAVPVYLEPEDAKELLAAAIAKLSADARGLRERIEEAEAEKKEKEVKKLKRKLAQVERLLDQFLVEMRRRGW